MITEQELKKIDTIPVMTTGWNIAGEHNWSGNKKKNKEENIIKGRKGTKRWVQYHKRYKYNKQKLTNLTFSYKITNNYNSLALPPIESASYMERQNWCHKHFISMLSKH